MARNPKQTASQADGVTYRRARTWEIALSQMNNGSAMIFYTLVGLMSYLQNAGYGIAVAVAGIILTVIPKVADSGRVLLDIEQEVSDVVPTTTSGCRSSARTWPTTAASISAADTRRTMPSSAAASPFSTRWAT